VLDKLVRAGRGGYCFEHATLFAAARVVLFAPRTDVPRDHMFLTVAVNGAVFVVDPGFGPFSPRFPVPLVDGDIGQDDTKTHWMTHDGAFWTLHVPRDGRSAPGWMSTLEQENLVDFEVANHFTATHPRSPFINWIMLSAATPLGRVNVMNRDITILDGNGLTPDRLADRAALRALSVEYFGFDMPEIERMTVPAIPEWQ
jgi:N-hydroxyarylamine O-acetyltransferase